MNLIEALIMVVAGPYHDGQVGVEDEANRGYQGHLGGNAGQAACGNLVAIRVLQVKAAAESRQQVRDVSAGHTCVDLALFLSKSMQYGQFL
jgi:hypothetical protein